MTKGDEGKGTSGNDDDCISKKSGREFELGTTEYKSNQQSGRDLNSGTPDYKLSALTAWPRCL